LGVTLNWLFVTIAGAIFGAIRRRRVNGVISGAVLALSLTASLFCHPENQKLDLKSLAIVAGSSASILLAGAKKLNIIDIPLDFRIVVAVLIAFFLRGALYAVKGLIR